MAEVHRYRKPLVAVVFDRLHGAFADGNFLTDAAGNFGFRAAGAEAFSMAEDFPRDPLEFLFAGRKMGVMHGVG